LAYNNRTLNNHKDENMTTLNSGKSNSWQTAMVQSITDPEELFELLGLDSAHLEAAKSAANLFPLQVPHSFVARMQKGNLDDPLLRQILPLGAELIETPGYQNDPLEEAKFNPVPGLLHKYTGRVLLTIVGVCGVNCRFCFRRHFPYTENNPGSEGWDRALNYIAQDESINEVILSGGDPLVVSDKILHNFSEKLNHIPHIKRLRIHSRMPIVLPERITKEFIEWVSQLQQKLILITHCNHPQEINQTVRDAMTMLADAGVTLLNQSVFLKGVNDNVDTLTELSETLFDAGIQPYYLHALDKVQACAHFDLELPDAQRLHWEMSQRLSGYLVPKFVCERPGAPAKISLAV
jgi:EF-P beta-lysylation protein EpmB